MSEPQTVSQTGNTSPASPRWRRLALVGAMFLITGVFGFLQPFTPLYLEASGLNKLQIGQLSALGTGAALLVQPVLGRLSDRFDTRRPLMFVAAIAAGLAYLAFRGAETFWGFTLLLAVGINGFQYLNSGSGVLLGKMAQAAGKGGGATYVRYRVWGSVGYILIGIAAGVLVKQSLAPNAALTRNSLDPVFTYGPLLFFVIAVLSLFVPEVGRTSPPPPPSPAEQERGESRSAEGNASGETVRYSAPTLIFSERNSPLSCSAGEGGGGGEVRPIINLNWFCAAYFLYQFSLYGASGFLPFYIRELGGSPVTVTAMFAAGVLCEVLVMSRVGRWTDTYGRRAALAFSFLLMPLRLLLYIPATGPLWVLAVQTLHGINFGIIGTIAVVFINDLARDGERGAMQAKLAATAGVGLALGPITCGWLADTWGIRPMFAAMSLVGMAAAVVFFYGVRESNPEAIPHRNRFVRWLAGTSDSHTVQ